MDEKKIKMDLATTKRMELWKEEKAGKIWIHLRSVLVHRLDQN